MKNSNGENIEKMPKLNQSRKTAKNSKNVGSWWKVEKCSINRKMLKGSKKKLKYGERKWRKVKKVEKRKKMSIKI